MSGAPRSKPRFVYVDNPANVQLFRLAPNTAKLDRDLTVSKTGFEVQTFMGLPMALASKLLSI